MPTKYLNINKFKGLQQNMDYPELPSEYCHVMQNLDCDNSLGVLKVRTGSAKLYSSPLTNIISAYEYRFDANTQTHLLVNDNGVLKVSIDGGAFASVTLPTDATFESGFKNQYLGYKNHVLISAGNGALNYMLWYGYINREIDDNTGLFGNVEEFTGYDCLRAQLVTWFGTFSNVRQVIDIGGYYYLCFENSRYIEKRDTSFQLVERFIASTNKATSPASVNSDVNICEDGTYIYVAYTNDDGDATVEKILPGGWAQQAEYTATLGGAIAGICTDGTNVYLATHNNPSGYIVEILCSTMVATGLDVNTTDEADILDICCDATADVGALYTLKAGQIERRSKVTLAYNAGEIYAGNSDQVHCVFDSDNDNVYVSSTTDNGHIYDYDATDFTGGEDNDWENIDEPGAFLKTISDVWEGISTKYGTLEEMSTTSTIAPRLVWLNLASEGSGDQVAGTYFYKCSLVDSDGEEYTLSDPIVCIHTAGSKNFTIRACVHTDDLADLYRVAYINLYRAFSSTSDAESPQTDYKFLKQIDINSSEWQSDKTDQELYFYDYVDNVLESEISSVTFFESSGIGDSVKPRFVNGKYMVLLNNQLHVANFSHDGITYKNRIIRSPSDQPDNISLYDYYDFDIGDGDEITDIGDSYGRSVVFKTRKFGMFINGIPERSFTPGISGSGAFAKKNESIYFVSDQGLYLFDGNECFQIHQPVKTYFDAASSYTNATVFYHEALDRIIFSLRADRTFILNLSYKRWMYYNSAFAYRGYFLDHAKQYVAFSQTNFLEVFNSSYVNDEEDKGGGNGTAIAIDYESPLLRFGSLEGQAITPVSITHRVYKGSDTVTFTLYDYQADVSGKTSVFTKALSAPGGIYAAANTYFFSSLLGESYSIRLNGNIDGGDFEYHGCTLEVSVGGLLYAV